MVQYVFALSLVFSIIIVIKAVLDLMNQVSQLRTKEVRIDHELETRRAEIPDKRKLVEVLRISATPRKRLHQKMRTYHEGLKQTELEDERRKMGEEETEIQQARPEREGESEKKIETKDRPTAKRPAASRERSSKPPKKREIEISRKQRGF